VEGPLENRRFGNLAKASEVHRESLRKNLQHRLTIARIQSNNQLLRQLMEEADYLRLN
jgi:hypothetical protein